MPRAAGRDASSDGARCAGVLAGSRAVLLACAGLLAGCGQPPDPSHPIETPSPTDPRPWACAGASGSAAVSVDPGHPVLRRLSRAELDATLFDLLGVDAEVMSTFPPDDTAGGFDDDGSVLGASPLFVEYLLKTVQQAATTAGQHESRLTSLLKRHASDCMTFNRACVQAVLVEFAHVAWRRPLSSDEQSKLLAFEAAAEARNPGPDPQMTVLGAAQETLTAILASPHFLYKVEIDADPNSTAAHRLEDHELAARLSFTLWLTGPDDALLAHADACDLHDPAVYAAEVDRLLASPRTAAFVHDFTSQWLRTRRLQALQPDAMMFPAFDEPLRAAMTTEVELLFTTWLVEDRPLADLIDANFTFANDRLAKHYGLPLPGGDAFARVSLDAAKPGGLLTRAGILSSTSAPTRTSPVRRGAFLLDALLCAPPPPPPANVPALPTMAPQGKQTAKEVLAAHLQSPDCAGCHADIDAVGLGFENYGVLGSWRDTDNGEPIDPSGRYPGGPAFAGPAQLVSFVKSDPRLGPCAASKLASWSLGEGIGTDDPRLVALMRDFASDGGRMGRLVRRLLTSTTFTHRRGGS